MKHYKGIIFDLDGTLLNTICDLSDSVNEVLQRYGYPTHTYEEYKQKIGKGFRNLLELSFPKDCLSQEEQEKALRMFLQIYDRTYRNKTVAYEGIPFLLQRLAEEKVKLAVNSNKRTDYTNQLIQKHFPEIPFVDVIGEREGIPKKPNPESALEIAGKMGLDTKEILYVGDSKTDMQTGKNANMDTIGVLWGFRDLKELQEHGADYIVEKAEEIFDLF